MKKSDLTGLSCGPTAAAFYRINSVRFAYHQSLSPQVFSPDNGGPVYWSLSPKFPHGALDGRHTLSLGIVQNGLDFAEQQTRAKGLIHPACVDVKLTTEM